MIAKLYHVSKPVPMWQVVYQDTLQCGPSGRAKRVRKHFTDREAAEEYQKKINKTVVVEGLAGIGFDANLRTDAVAARMHLDARGHSIGLLQLAERYSQQVTAHATIGLPIGPEVAAFLEEKEHIDGSAKLTVANLKTRIGMWADLAKISFVGDITREAVEVLRTRPVSAQTRKNDINAVSNFCTWLVDKRKLDHHPLKGVKRPSVKHGKKPTFTVEECGRVLAAAAKSGRLGTLAVMIFSGARPSELLETRLIYGRHPMVRIEGGKLKGRANRVVPMSTALRAFLVHDRSPEQVVPLTRFEREQIGAAAAIKWKPDICRHTYISNRLQLAQNDGLVARESGTSEDIIYRHYHGLKSPAEARKWERLRPQSQ